MGDGRANLALDIVADDRQTFFTEFSGPLIRTGNKDWNGVDHSAACFQNLVGVPSGGVFGAHRQVIDDHIGFGLLEDFNHIIRIARGFFQDLSQIFPQAIQGIATVNFDAHMGNVREFDGVVGFGVNRLGDVFTNLSVDHIKCSSEFNIANMIAGPG